MKITKLSPQQQDRTGFTHKINITYADVAGFTSGVAAQVFPAGSGTLPAGSVVGKAAFNLITTFDGGATSALTMQVGDAGVTNRFITAKSVHADATPILFWEECAATLPYGYTVADALDVIFTLTGGTMGALTSGEVELYIQVYDLNDLERPRGGGA